MHVAIAVHAAPNCMIGDVSGRIKLKGEEGGKGVEVDG